MEFVNVTGVKIPEGEVTKIRETDTGRILWEKQVWPEITSPSWLVNQTYNIDAGNGQGGVMLGISSIKYAGYDYNKHNGGDYPVKDYPILLGIRHAPGVVNYMSELRQAKTDAYGIGVIDYWGIDGLRICYMPLADPTDTNILRVRRLGQNGNDYYAFIAMSDVAQDTYTHGVGHDYKSLVIYKDNYGLGDCYFSLGVPSSATTAYQSSQKVRIMPFSLARNADVWITYAEERAEYLVTGLNGKSLIVPEENFLTANLNLQNSQLRRTKWVSELNMYFGAKNTNSNKISYSQDGVSWTDVKAFTRADVYALGIEWVAANKKLCAISSNSNKIALSSDGITWEQKDTPFSAALAYSYSPDYNILCVLDASGAYITRDFKEWQQIKLPQNAPVNFRDIKYVAEGIFVAYEYYSNFIYFFSLSRVVKEQFEQGGTVRYPFRG